MVAEIGGCKHFKVFAEGEQLRLQLLVDLHVNGDDGIIGGFLLVLSAQCLVALIDEVVDGVFSKRIPETVVQYLIAYQYLFVYGHARSLVSLTAKIVIIF
jgi:hypothetical protein